MNNIIMSAKKTNCSIDGKQYVEISALLDKVKRVQEKVKDRTIDEMIRCAVMWVIMDNGPGPYEPEFTFKENP